MLTGSEYALQAQSEKYTGVPYSKLDCQAFVEQVLKDCGVRKPDGSAYNWRGSNAMWRQALGWKGTVDECINLYGEIPLGAWVFIVKNDGGEQERGYHDNEGNATHVGIYCRYGDEPVRDSTKTSKRDGVGYRTMKSFNMIGLPSMIDYNSAPQSNTVTLPEALKALEVLTKYLKGV